MGPLHGIKVIEFTGLGPAPFAAMMLADLGAEVICIERRSSADPLEQRELSRRGKRSIALNLKAPQGIAIALQLLADADVLIEGFRPGVMERLGLGPQPCLARNPRLVYGRMTGWGQTGPLAHSVGHDLNYIALTGVLHAIGRAGERPVPPLNLVGDFGGGGMLLNIGILSALLEVKTSGKGQVVDAAMTDGSALLMTMLHSLVAQQRWNAELRGSNMLDGAAHFYDTYETADSKYIALAAIEPQFYMRFLQLMGLDPVEFGAQQDATLWPVLKEKLQLVFKTRTRAAWCDLLEGSDACVAPVLSMVEAPTHPHNAARATYVTMNGIDQPAPAPRFERTPGQIRHSAPLPGADNDAVLNELGFNAAARQLLRDSGVLV